MRILRFPRGPLLSTAMEVVEVIKDSQKMKEAA